MKKSIRLFLILLFLSSLSLYAQPPAHRPDGLPRGERPPIPNAEQFTERMTKELGLNAAASKKVHDAFLKNIKQMEDIFTSKIEEREKRVALDAHRKSFEKTMKSILSASQFAKFQKLEAEHHGPPPPPINGERPPRPR
ncbi:MULTISPECIES: hypothetical protein [Emticicia]|uniref:hypothetical protein n=1 Tax=Emticicia TaxID=312278 RepID=UPI0007D8C75A|nr:MULTISPECIES: hypothetical protein [Emticicia]